MEVLTSPRRLHPILEENYNSAGELSEDETRSNCSEFSENLFLSEDSLEVSDNERSRNRSDFDRGGLSEYFISSLTKPEVKGNRPQDKSKKCRDVHFLDSENTFSSILTPSATLQSSDVLYLNNNSKFSSISVPVAAVQSSDHSSDYGEFSCDSLNKSCDSSSSNEDAVICANDEFEVNFSCFETPKSAKNSLGSARNLHLTPNRSDSTLSNGEAVISVDEEFYEISRCSEPDKNAQNSSVANRNLNSTLNRSDSTLSDGEAVISADDEFYRNSSCSEPNRNARHSSVANRNLHLTLNRSDSTLSNGEAVISADDEFYGNSRCSEPDKNVKSSSVFNRNLHLTLNRSDSTLSNGDVTSIDEEFYENSRCSELDKNAQNSSVNLHLTLNRSDSTLSSGEAVISADDEFYGNFRCSEPDKNVKNSSVANRNLHLNLKRSDSTLPNGEAVFGADGNSKRSKSGKNGSNSPVSTRNMHLTLKRSDSFLPDGEVVISAGDEFCANSRCSELENNANTGSVHVTNLCSRRDSPKNTENIILSSSELNSHVRSTSQSPDLESSLVQSNNSNDGTNPAHRGSNNIFSSLDEHFSSADMCAETANEPCEKFSDDGINPANHSGSNIFSSSNGTFSAPDKTFSSEYKRADTAKELGEKFSDDRTNTAYHNVFSLSNETFSSPNKNFSARNNRIETAKGLGDKFGDNRTNTAYYGTNNDFSLLNETFSSPVKNFSARDKHTEIANELCENFSDENCNLVPPSFRERTSDVAKFRENVNASLISLDSLDESFDFEMENDVKFNNTRNVSKDSANWSYDIPDKSCNERDGRFFESLNRSFSEMSENLQSIKQLSIKKFEDTLALRNYLEKCDSFQALLEKYVSLKNRAEGIQTEIKLKAEMAQLRDDIIALAENVLSAPTDRIDRNELEKYIIQMKKELESLQERKLKLTLVNLKVHQFKTESGVPVDDLKAEVAKLYQIWDYNYNRVSSQLESLQRVSNIWKQFEAHRNEFLSALGDDEKTIQLLDTALQDGDISPDIATSVRVVAKVLSEKHDDNSPPESLTDTLSGATSLLEPCSGEGSLSDSGISDSGSEQDICEREKRLGEIRKLAKEMDLLSPGSLFAMDVNKRVQEMELKLRELQRSCRNLIVKTAVCAETSCPAAPRKQFLLTSKRCRSPAALKEELLATADDGDDSDKPSQFWRILKCSMPFHLAIMLLVCVACLLEPHCCDSLNNFHRSIAPQMRYLYGPPPI